MAHNPGIPLDMGWINGVGTINLPAVKRRAESLGGRRTVKVGCLKEMKYSVLNCVIILDQVMIYRAVFDLM